VRLLARITADLVLVLVLAVLAVATVGQLDHNHATAPPGGRPHDKPVQVAPAAP
jgi:hypothetical protein